MTSNNQNTRSGQGSGQILSMVLGVALLIALGFLMWLVFTRLLQFLESADPSVSAAIVGAIATVLVGLGVALYTQTQIKVREIENAHRSRKVEIYSGFLDFVGKTLSTSNSANEQPNKELVKFFEHFHTNLILWGSPKVINAYLDFKRHSNDRLQVMDKVDALYRSIREDLGLDTRGLSSRQLVKLYLKDPDELDKLGPPRA